MGNTDGEEIPLSNLNQAIRKFLSMTANFYNRNCFSIKRNVTLFLRANFKYCFSSLLYGKRLKNKTNSKVTNLT